MSRSRWCKLCHFLLWSCPVSHLSERCYAREDSLSRWTFPWLPASINVCLSLKAIPEIVSGTPWQGTFDLQTSHERNTSAGIEFDKKNFTADGILLEYRQTCPLHFLEDRTLLQQTHKCPCPDTKSRTLDHLMRGNCRKCNFLNLASLGTSLHPLLIKFLTIR